MGDLWVGERDLDGEGRTSGGKGEIELGRGAELRRTHAEPCQIQLLAVRGTSLMGPGISFP